MPIDIQMIEASLGLLFGTLVGALGGLVGLSIGDFLGGLVRCPTKN